MAWIAAVIALPLRPPDWFDAVGVAAVRENAASRRADTARYNNLTRRCADRKANSQSQECRRYQPLHQSMHGHAELGGAIFPP